MRVFILWKECEHIFTRIQANGVDENIIEDLKEYINDVESSLLKIENIIEFKEVLLFYQMVLKNKNTLEQLITNLRN